MNLDCTRVLTSCDTVDCRELAHPDTKDDGVSGTRMQKNDEHT